MYLTSYDVMRIAPTSAGSGIQTSFPKGKCAKNDVHRTTPVHAGAVLIERRVSDEHILEYIGLVGTVCRVRLLHSYARVSWAALHTHEHVFI